MVTLHIPVLWIQVLSGVGLGEDRGYSWQAQIQSPDQFSFSGMGEVFLASSDPISLSPPGYVPILGGGIPRIG